MYLDTGNFGEYIPVLTTDRNVLTLDDLSIKNPEPDPTKASSKMSTLGKSPKKISRNKPARRDRKKIDETPNNQNPNKRITRNK